jgi:hypothetical protein
MATWITLHGRRPGVVFSVNSEKIALISSDQDGGVLWDSFSDGDGDGLKVAESACAILAKIAGAQSKEGQK